MRDVMISHPESVQELLVNATRALGQAMDYREARLQAEMLLAHALDTSRTDILARLHETVLAELAARYAASVARRAKFEPLAYILGHQEFYRLDFVVDRRVMIPRHETELLVQYALESARQLPHTTHTIADVGTGSGAIALSIAHNLPHASIFAVDISRDALDVAKLNARRLALEKVTFVDSDLFEKIDFKLDIVIANLPYVPSSRYSELPVEVRRFEPRVALDGGPDGLGVVKRLLAQLPSHMQRGAVALLEISEEQGQAALDLIHRILPEATAQLHKDMEGMDRMVEVRVGFPLGSMPLSLRDNDSVSDAFGKH